MKKTLLMIGVIVFISACSPTNQQETPVPAVNDSAAGIEQTESEVMVTDDTTGEIMMEQTQASVIELDADNFSYTVNEIRVKQGQPLTLKVTNKEGFHDLLIDELSVNSGMIPAGETKELTIPTDKPGTYEYYCSVGDHRAKGMKGTLIIE